MAIQQPLTTRAASNGLGGIAVPDDVTTSSAIVAKRLLAMGAAGSMVFTVTWLIEGATRPGYDAVRQPISALSLGPGAWVQALSFLLFGLALGCSTLGYRLALAPGLGVNAIPVLRMLAAVGLMRDGVFAQDPSTGYPVGVTSRLTPESPRQHPPGGGCHHHHRALGLLSGVRSALCR